MTSTAALDTVLDLLRTDPQSEAELEHLAREAQLLPTGELVAGLAEHGWRDLSNARGALSVKGMRLGLVGVDDPHLDYDDYASVSAPAAPDAALTIGVTHAPYRRVLDAMAADEEFAEQVEASVSRVLALKEEMGLLRCGG